MHMVVHVIRDLCYRFTSVGVHFFLRMPTISILFFLLKQRFQLALFLFTKERIYILYYFVFGTTKLLIVDLGHREALLIKQCLGTSSQCDHTSRFIRLETQRAGDSPHSG